jgi:deoxyribodipyrimidine photo-lyase
LRLHDNPALCKSVELSAKSSGSGILPVFIFDTTRIFGSNIPTSIHGPEYNSIKCGPKRAQFVLESVADLRRNLETHGSGLLVAVGRPENVLADIARRFIETETTSSSGSSSEKMLNINIICQEEVCSEELAVDKAIRREMASTLKGGGKGNKFQFVTVWGGTMYNPNDLPFEGNVAGIPDTFTPFRTKVEKYCKIGSPLAVPVDTGLQLVNDVKAITNAGAFEYMPTLAELGYTIEDIEKATTIDERTAMPSMYRGGETYALARVQDYIWDKDLIKVYFDTRNGMIGSDYSTKFSPWLAHGNVSPRYIARECRRYEESRVQNKSTYWVVFELLWRDYFKFFAKKHGNSIFQLGGTIRDTRKKWGMNIKSIQAWREGRTGYPLVDANMRELLATGFMSNRGRQNVCSFLTIDMNMDWRYGAAHFEEHLLDHDVHSNWGNWCSGAGMTGGRLNRFNIVKQSKDYDFGGDYVRLWCPELANVPDKYVHEPWKMSEALMLECGVKIGPGRDYPSPIVDPNFSPKIMDDSGGRGGSGGGRGSRNDRGGRGSGGRGGNGGSNHNRGRGQRQDMKSLKTGSYAFDSKYI